MDNVEQFAESVVIIIGAIILFIQQRKQGKQNKEANEKLTNVENTLTSTNGGTHVKDHLLNIENQLLNTDKRLTAIEAFQQMLSGRITGIDSRLTAHIASSLTYMQTLVETKDDVKSDSDGSGV